MSAAAGAALTVARSISPIITFSYLPISAIPSKSGDRRLLQSAVPSA
jgi:hypothetical protein